MSNNIRPKPVVLCILDGWGEREDAEDNAIAQGNTPFWDNLVVNCPMSLLETSGLAVGLPEGQMGNSEVGHMNIGSGRVVMQNLPRIDKSMEDGSLKNDSQISHFIQAIKDNDGVAHIMGLMSPGGVHSHQGHMAKLAVILADSGLSVKVHAFLDGRDVPPNSAVEYIQTFEKDVVGYDVEVVTACGRYYAMDRDNRWDRVELAYNALVSSKGNKVDSICDAIKENYESDVYDEFIKPIILNGYDGMNNGDGLLMANFRSDRARQIMTCLLDKGFDGFDRSNVINFSSSLGMVEYSDALNKLLGVLFKPIELKNILGEVIANQGLKQLRVAETEKYAHVTFFFNSGREDVFEGEERIMVPSPNVATYDLQPEMSAIEVTDELVGVINAQKFDLIVVNYANTDMVGHTGNKEAAIKAVETIDSCLDRLVGAVEGVGGCIFITADHGNSEQMVNEETGAPHTSHTTNPVPFIMAGLGAENYELKNGSLCDIAPTILSVMGIDIPADMTGGVLFSG